MGVKKMKKNIQTNKAPQAVGPYQQGVIYNAVVYTSGQLPLCPLTNMMPATIEEQTKQALENCKAVLEAGGSDLNHVLKVTVFVLNMDHFATINQIYATYFQKGHYPARSLVQVTRLPKDAQIEIEMIGYQK